MIITLTPNSPLPRLVERFHHLHVTFSPFADLTLIAGSFASGLLAFGLGSLLVAAWKPLAIASGVSALVWTFLPYVLAALAGLLLLGMTKRGRKVIKKVLPRFNWRKLRRTLWGSRTNGWLH